MLGLLLVVISGCKTTPRAPTPLGTVFLTNNFEVAPPAPLTTTPTEHMEPTITTVPPPAPTSVATSSSWPTNWINVWVPLEAWGKYNGLEKFTVLKSNPHPIYQFSTSRGAVALKIGTRIASCFGFEFWLGYAPQLVKGIPYVHWLDARKVLQPLLHSRRLGYHTNRVIVLDPGHGGLDSGTRSIFNSKYEKEYTLDWALRLSQILEARGWKVVLTRTNDRDIALSERVAIADRANADFFLSLHFNSAFPNRDLIGIETYCLTPTGMPSSLLRSQDDDLQQNFPNNAFDEQNLQIAIQLHGALMQVAESSDRGVKHARFMGVLRGQNRPAVLIEGGYLSNPREARKIETAEYRQKLAEGVADGLKTLE